MKKNIIILAVTIICYGASAQVIFIKDSVLQTGISGVHISTINGTLGVVSNIEGQANINIFKDTDTLVFSHIGYKEVKILCNKVENEVVLASNAFVLEEVLISQKSAYSILKESVELQNRIMSQDLRFNAYYREFVETNGNFTKYADGNLIYELRSKKKNYKTTPYIVESRKYDLTTDEDVDIDFISPVDLRVLVNYNRLENFGKFLSQEHSDKYTYSFIESHYPGTYQIKVVPESGVDEVLYRAEIIIDRNSGFITQIKYQSDSELIRHSKEYSLLGIKIKMTDNSGTLIFKQYDGKNYLHYGNIEFNVDVSSKEINQTSKFNSEILVSINTLEPSSELKPYKHKSLYKSDGEYKSEFWKDGASIPLTKEKERLFVKLEENFQ